MTKEIFSAFSGFGLGYIVTAGYYIRCFMHTQYRWRACIWILSIVVQSGWLIFFLGIARQDEQPFGLGWLITIFVSIAGLLLEFRDITFVDEENIQSLSPDSYQ